jgi:hypothetical protein
MSVHGKEGRQDGCAVRRVKARRIEATFALSERDGLTYDAGGQTALKARTRRKESPMRIGTIIAALLALLALVMPGPAYAGGAFALPPVACNIIIIILVIVIIYLLWSRRRP